MGYIARAIIEAKIDTLIRKRDEAIKNRKYRKAWMLQTEIDKNISTMIKWSYYKFGV